MKQNSNLGILIPLTWDDNKWEKGEDFDFTNAQFRYIKDYLTTQEKIIYGHKKYPLEVDGTYIGYSRMLTRILKTDENFYWNSNDFKIVFFSSNYRKSYIVGFYLSPQIDWSHGRRVKNEIYSNFNFGNIRAKGSDIVRFDNYLPINEYRTLSSVSKDLKTLDYSYLSKKDILEILDVAVELNPEQEDLRVTCYRLKEIL